MKEQTLTLSSPEHESESTWFHVRGIRGRWMLNGIAVVLIAVIASVCAFSIAISRYYHTGLLTGLESKAQTAAEFFTTYVSRTYTDYIQSAYRYTATFDDRDKIELQFINDRGRVEMSSYGITSGTLPLTADIQEAISSGEICSFTGTRLENGERILSVSSPLTANGQVVGVMRYVTSLRLVDRQVRQFTLIASGIGFLIVMFIVATNLYFLKTITDPIRELTGIAKNIAKGSYGVQAEKKYDDEIGDLIDTINEMSVKICKAEKTQTEFVSSVSHELRTPLTAITGWSETLLYDDTLQEDTRKGLSIISKEAGRLTKMVEELLEFTRMQDGQFTLSVRPIDIAAELEEAIYTYRELLTKENMQLIYAPPIEAFPMIHADPERLRQVFLNVLDNAAKYGKDGEKIIVSLQRVGEYVEISIRDFGPGIPEEEMDHVKKKFYKGRSKERGSGIGLAVCEEIMTRHRGRLKLENAQGGGLIVMLQFPI